MITFYRNCKQPFINEYIFLCQSTDRVYIYTLLFLYTQSLITHGEAQGNVYQKKKEKVCTYYLHTIENPGNKVKTNFSTQLLKYIFVCLSEFQTLLVNRGGLNEIYFLH